MQLLVVRGLNVCFDCYFFKLCKHKHLYDICTYFCPCSISKSMFDMCTIANSSALGCWLPGLENQLGPYSIIQKPEIKETDSLHILYLLARATHHRTGKYL